MAGGLNANQIRDYRNDGFVKPVRVFAESEAQRIRDEIEALERQCREKGRSRKLHRYFRVNGQVVIPLLAEVSRTPAILDAVECIIGPNILVWSCELFIKEPGSQHVVSWHQDLTYWGMGGSDLQATAWIAISDATAESGCMRFVPGSHKRDILAHVDTFGNDNMLSRGQEVAVDVDEDAAVLDDLLAGEMSIHHGRIFHASGPNRSSDRRIGMAIRYVAPELVRSSPGRDYAMLVRGMDKHDTWINIAPPAALFGKSETALYATILEDQLATLAEGAERDVQLYAAAAQA